MPPATGARHLSMHACTACASSWPCERLFLPSGLPCTIGPCFERIAGWPDGKGHRAVDCRDRLNRAMRQGVRPIVRLHHAAPTVRRTRCHHHRSTRHRPMMNSTTISSTRVKPRSLWEGQVIPCDVGLFAVNIRIFILAAGRAIGPQRIYVERTITARIAILIRPVPRIVGQVS